MRAIVLTSICEPNQLHISELPKPAPAPGQVLIRVGYCALNPLDTHARGGRIKWGVPALPFTLGYEYAGRVEAVGEGVDAAWIGRRVSTFGCWGGCADYAVAPATALNPVPEALDGPTAAAFFTTTYTSWHLVHTAGHVQRGQTVVVHSAAGAVGVMLTQILKEAGARVIGLTSQREKAEWAKGYGVDDWIITGDEPYDAAVKRLTQGAGADLIIDGVQGPDAGRNLASLKPFGRVIYIGATGGLAPPVNISQLIGSSLGVQGFVIQHAMALTKGRWKLPISDPLSLEDVGKAHADFEGRKLVGRTVFQLGGDV